jgi:hypothetical protein
MRPTEVGPLRILLNVLRGTGIGPGSPRSVGPLRGARPSGCPYLARRTAIHGEDDIRFRSDRPMAKARRGPETAFAAHAFNNAAGAWLLRAVA